MKAAVVLFFGFFVGLAHVHAQESLFDVHLRKLSIVLRGQTPSKVEYDHYRQIKSSKDTDQALQQASLDFVNSKEFAVKFSNKTANLFRIFQMPVETKAVIDFENPPQNLVQSAPHTPFNFLVREIFTKDLPWSELLARTEYYSISNESIFDFEVKSRRFYAALQPENFQSTVSQEQIVDFLLQGKDFEMIYDKFQFPRGDLRVAGIFTTPEFIKRYVTTGVNKNRKRAAAIFRTMLCNDMVAAIPASKDGVDEEKKVALLGVDEYTEEDIVNHVKGLQVHGSNPECMKCHRQLDPLGELFGFVGDRLASDPSPGGLVFKSESGAEVNMPDLKGIGELASAMTQQEDFFSCQVRHFWNWVYGENRLLTPKQEIVLVNKFKELNLKPKSFVKHLVDQKEFYQAKTYTEAQIVTFGAYKTLKKCQSCHNVQEEDEEMQNINWFEVIDNKSHPRRASLINSSLRQMTKNYMPPPESKTDFSDAELTNLTKWLKDYKTNFDGE